jgi:hypothetical protein
MNGFRTRLGAYAVALLVCQSAALLAAPAVVCRMDAAVVAEGESECCTHLGPGETCPMHHRSNGAPKPKGPSWKCVCVPGDAALLSLLGVSGTLPAPVPTIESSNGIQLIASLTSPLDERAETPRAPPPRA